MNKYAIKSQIFAIAHLFSFRNLKVKVMFHRILIIFTYLILLDEYLTKVLGYSECVEPQLRTFCFGKEM